MRRNPQIRESRGKKDIDFHVGRIAHAITEMKLIENCLECVNFDEPTEVCKLANARPPARVIAYGCDSFDDGDNIPY